MGRIFFVRSDCVVVLRFYGERGVFCLFLECLGRRCCPCGVLGLFMCGGGSGFLALSMDVGTYRGTTCFGVCNHVWEMDR